MEGIGTVTFLIRVVSDLSRRRGNHMPQRFDSLNECKLNDETCPFHFSHDENIKEFLAIRRAISLNETFVLFC